MFSPTSQTISRDHLKFTFNNADEFESIYKDIFINKDYYFKTKTARPYIVDCGAHIGISVLYFKSLFPNAKIVAFEPNPYSFQLLSQNIKQNHLQSITAVNKAVGVKSTPIKFTIPQDPSSWSIDSTSVDSLKSQTYKLRQVSVESTDLNKYLTSQIDLLKLDVQGLETKVMISISRNLSKVHNIKLEYHGKLTESTNNLDQILSILNSNFSSVWATQAGQRIDLQTALGHDLKWIIIHASK